MKLARKEIIQACEKHLIRLIAKNIDKSVLKAAIREKYDLTPGDDISVHHGDIVIRDNQIVYKLDFSLQASLSVLLDRNGEPLDITASDKAPGEGELAPGAAEEDNKTREMAAEIAQMISEINEE